MKRRVWDFQKAKRFLILFRQRTIILVMAVLASISTVSFGSRSRALLPLMTAEAPRRPFGGHSFPYTAGTIKPSGFSQIQLDQVTKDFYDQWKKKYLRSGCGPERFYIWSRDSSGGGKAPLSASVSEGHGYGMIIAALMAGHDPQAKTYFDGMFRYFKDHPAKSSPNLMAWNQLEDCTNSPAPFGGTGTATDGDLDIAFALILADRQWGSRIGAINYLREAKKMIRTIFAVEVSGRNETVLLGDFVDSKEPKYFNGTRPSDFMPDHFRAFRTVTEDRNWTGVINKSYKIIQRIQSKYSPITGLVPTHSAARKVRERSELRWLLLLRSLWLL